MKSMRFWAPVLLLACGLVLACVDDLYLTVLYDHAAELKPDDRVFWQEQTIGKVQSVKSSPTGPVAVRLQIKRDFRQKVTDLSRFLIQVDPQNHWQRSVEMIHLAEGGNPLPDGSELKGSTFLSLQLERGTVGLKAWSKLLQQELYLWEKELKKLPVKKWYGELERQMEYWASELEKAGEETRRRFREEVLPRLEEAVRELQKRLRELGKKKDIKILDVKLEKLKRI